MNRKEIPYAGLQGISQQPPALTSDQHVADMLGFFPTINEGLQVTPPYIGSAFCDPTALPSGVFESDWLYMHMTPEGTSVQLKVIMTGDAANPLRAYTEDGTEVTVQYGADVKDYLTSSTPRESLQGLFVGDELLVVNKEQTVTALSTPTIPVEWAGENGAVITVKLAVDAEYYFLLDSTTYSTTVSVNDAPSTIASNIATELDGATGFSATAIGNRVEVNKDDNTAFVLESFGDASSFTHILSSITNSWAELPADAPEGTIVKITPDIENADIKPYWALYLKDGGWREYQDPASTVGYDSTEMPISITYSVGSGTLVAQTKTYAGRVVGDEDTNKDPYFVGSKIIGMLDFQERVGYVTTRGISWSATGNPTRLYRASALETFEDDPIHMRLGSGSNSANIIDATVFHDVVFVSTTAGKYIIEGGRQGFSPTSYTTSRVSSLSGVSDVAPMLVRDKLYFATERGKHLMLSEYGYEDDAVIVTPDDVTENVPRLIPSACNVGYGLGEAGCIFMTDADDPSASLYAYRFETKEGDTTYSRDAKLQSAWFRLKKPEDCVGIIQTVNGLQFITTEGYVYDFNINERLPIRSRKVLECEDLALDGEWLITLTDALSELELTTYRLVAEYSDGSFSYGLSSTVLDEAVGKLFVDPEVYGYNIVKLYAVVEDAEGDTFVKFHRPYPRDKEGNSQTHGVMRVRGFSLDALNAGQFAIRSVLSERDIPDASNVEREVVHGEDFALGVQALTFMDGATGRTFHLPISSRSDGLNVSVYPQGVRPLDITNIAYTYRFVTKNSRTN